MFMDPGKFGKEYFDEMEKMFVGRFNELLRDQEFLGTMGKGVLAGLDGKKAMDEALKKSLESAGLPTRADVAKILQYLQTIESRIIDLEEKVEDLADRLPSPRPAPAKKGRKQ
jgi:hypothetical protein